MNSGQSMILPAGVRLITDRLREAGYFTANGKLNADQAKFLAPRRPAEELYDLKADPWELRNRAAAPADKETLTRLRRELDRWIKDTHDAGAVPEDPEALRQILKRHQQSMERQFGTSDC